MSPDALTHVRDGILGEQAASEGKAENRVLERGFGQQDRAGGHCREALAGSV